MDAVQVITGLGMQCVMNEGIKLIGMDETLSCIKKMVQTFPIVVNCSHEHLTNGHTTCTLQDLDWELLPSPLSVLTLLQVICANKSVPGRPVVLTYIS